MSWEILGAVLVFLVVVFIIGHLWFAIVEGMLNGLKRLFCRKKQGAWHTLPPERKKGEDEQI